MFKPIAPETRAKIADGIDMAARAAVFVTFVAVLGEVAQHPSDLDELCVAGKGAAATAIAQATGNFPSWTPTEYSPVAVTSMPEAMNALLAGSTVAATTPPRSHCF